MNYTPALYLPFLSNGSSWSFLNSTSQYYITYSVLPGPTSLLIYGWRNEGKFNIFDVALGSPSQMLWNVLVENNLHAMNKNNILLTIISIILPLELLNKIYTYRNYSIDIIVQETNLCIICHLYSDIHAARTSTYTAVLIIMHMQYILSNYLQSLYLWSKSRHACITLWFRRGTLGGGGVLLLPIF